MNNPLRYRTPQTGQYYKDNGEPVNIADMIEAFYKAAIVDKNLGLSVGGVDITPDDTKDIPLTRGLFVGTSGNLKMTMANGTTITRKNVPVGLYPWSVKRIWATDTTAKDIIGEY